MSSSPEQELAPRGSNAADAVDDHASSGFRLRFNLRAVLLLVTLCACFFGLYSAVHFAVGIVAGMVAVTAGGVYAALEFPSHRGIGALRGRPLSGTEGGAVAGLLLILVFTALRLCGQPCVLFISGAPIIFLFYWWISAGAIVGAFSGCAVAALLHRSQAELRTRALEFHPRRLDPTLVPAEPPRTRPPMPPELKEAYRAVPGLFASLFVHVALFGLVGSLVSGWDRVSGMGNDIALVVKLGPVTEPTVEEEENDETESFEVSALEVADVEPPDDKPADPEPETEENAELPEDEPLEVMDAAQEQEETNVLLAAKTEAIESAQTPADPELREWKDKSGDFSVNARLLDHRDGEVLLRKDNGKFARVPLDQLSLPDEIYARTHLNLPLPSIVAGHGGFSSRSADGRKRALQRGGGTAATDAAVQAALDWLVRFQNDDGSWSFGYTELGNCTGFANPGTTRSKMGATGFSLMAFLAAGYSHQEQPDMPANYHENVARGLRFLLRSGIQQKDTLRLFEADGSSQEHMYCHAVATCALVEAYGMTGDAELAYPAQHSLNYIFQAQDPVAGGWRYTPRAGSDTSVYGWQVMAIKSGVLGQLKVPGIVQPLANRWLDQVQRKPTRGRFGSRYGYSGPRNGTEAMTAVGLLCRMYLGAHGKDSGIRTGIRRLAKMGPQPSDIYFNYHATLAIYQAAGPNGASWHRWNLKMRDLMLSQQEKEGLDTGSWYFPSNHGSSAGRLYCTAMGALTMTVYYRYPIIRDARGHNAAR